MKPPFEITNKILAYSSEISKIIGLFEGFHSPIPQPQLRRQNHIKTIQGSLAIELNTLSLEQITDIMNGKRVIGDPREILEIRNAV